MSATFREILSLAESTTAWLLTYAIHSTLFLAIAWAISSRLPLPSRELTWKVALVAGLVTASLQWASPWNPALGNWALGTQAPQMNAVSPANAESAPSKAASAVATEALSNGGSQTPAFLDLIPPENPSQEAAAGVVTLANSGSLDPAVWKERANPASDNASLVSWSTVAAGLWLAFATLGLAALATAYRGLRRQLADRQPVAEGPLPELFQHLRQLLSRNRSVALRQSSALQVPIARGVLHAEICVPHKASSLPRDEQESMLAHEMAHVARRDPAWLLFSRVLERAFFFQPLNRLARRQLQEIAEYRSDDWAARATGRPLSLARCLTEVAQWNLSREAPLPVPGMAARGSALRRRVQRLLEISKDEAPEPQRFQRWMPLYAAFVVIAVAVTVPGFTGPTADPAPPTPEAPASPEAPRPISATPEAGSLWASLEAPESPTAPTAESVRAQRTRTAPRTPESPEATPAPPSPPSPVAEAGLVTKGQSVQRIPEVRVPAVTVAPIRVPAVQVPSVPVPEIRVPKIQIPAIRVPKVSFTGEDGVEVEIPEINIPEFEIPEIHIEAFATPIVDIPEINIPKIDIPEIQIPEMAIPEGLSEEDEEALRLELERQLGDLEELESRVHEQVESSMAVALEHVQQMAFQAEEMHEDQVRVLEEKVREQVERQQERIEEQARIVERQRVVIEERARDRARQQEDIEKRLERQRAEPNIEREKAREKIEQQREQAERKREQVERKRERLVSERVIVEQRARDAAARSQEVRQRAEQQRSASEARVRRSREQAERAREEREEARKARPRHPRASRETQREIRDEAQPKPKKPSRQDRQQARAEEERRLAYELAQKGLELERIRQGLANAKQAERSAARSLRLAQRELVEMQESGKDAAVPLRKIHQANEQKQFAQAAVRDLKRAYRDHPMYPSKHQWQTNSLPGEDGIGFESNSH